MSSFLVPIVKCLLSTVQVQQDALLNQLIKMATNKVGEELIYELCTAVQGFLVENGCKIFSSFYEEMEDRRRLEERKKSEGEYRIFENSDVFGLHPPPPSPTIKIRDTY